MRTPLLLLVTTAATLGAQARPAAGPLAPWPAVAELPGMGRAIDTAVTATRRQALARRIGKGIVIVPAARERDLELDYVQDNDFRQHNAFFYLTQLEAKDAWLVMTVLGPGDVEVKVRYVLEGSVRKLVTALKLQPSLLIRLLMLICGLSNIRG